MEFIWSTMCYALATLVVLLIAALGKKALLTMVATNWYKKWWVGFENRYAEFGKEAFHPAKQKLSEQLKKTLESIGGDVVEIGIGGGANLSYYPAGTSLIAVDLSPFAENVIRENIKKLSSNVILKRCVVASCDDMNPKEATGVADKSVAAVVCTNLMCSLTESQLKKTLQEIKRVLKPGGRFFFLEHVQDKPGSLRHYIQRLIDATGLVAVLFGNCHLSRKTWLSLEQAGFKTLSYERFVVEIPPKSWSLHLCVTLYLSASTMSGYAEI